MKRMVLLLAAVALPLLLEARARRRKKGTIMRGDHVPAARP
ncbi:MAG: hypothetical protein PHW10_06375 [Candidatus Peribacteraceae bacterium]|nr:hypothetical protein [Candidatus Peribacteraceae bacterium]